MNTIQLLSKLFLCDTSVENILKTQYYLAKYANISLIESNNLPEFELNAFLNMIKDDIRKEEEALNSGKH